MRPPPTTHHDFGCLDKPEYDCDVTNDRPPADPVWSKIWAKGGQLEEPLRSILGSTCPDPCPRPSLAL